MKFSSDIVIGLEIHVELDTKTKLFCSCKRRTTEKPNTNVCPICLGHPGARPVLNKKALDNALKLCLALDSDLSKELIFSRKSYFYPDMSKNFQITQFEQPLGLKGKLQLKTGKIINLTQIHIEEDPAALIYPKGMKSSSYVLIDYNRAGNPLVEIVTEPELTSPAEAREFLNQLVSILTYLKIFDINACTIKADANVSIKEGKYQRVEIKNIGGFKELEKALTYEITRQKTLLRRGLKVKMETRGWNEAGKTTISLRTKETEADYGYIIEPDLSIIDITDELIEVMRKEIPELAQQKSERFIKEYKLDKVDAQVMAMELELADLFEKVAKKINPKLAARWLRKELLRVLNYNKRTAKEINFDEKEIIELLSLVQTKTISETTAQRIMEKLMSEKFSPKEYVEKEGLIQVSSESEIKELCRRVIKEQEKAVKDYLAGEEKSFHYLVGQVMKLTKGKADPILTDKIMKEELKTAK
jgi:aspartyl-tRNA(Asn)/glutamyl-tRNA(Gln) amidotransferase subunit B